MKKSFVYLVLLLGLAAALFALPEKDFCEPESTSWCTKHTSAGGHVVWACVDGSDDDECF